MKNIPCFWPDAPLLRQIAFLSAHRERPKCMLAKHWCTWPMLGTEGSSTISSADHLFVCSATGDFAMSVGLRGYAHPPRKICAPSKLDHHRCARTPRFLASCLHTCEPVDTIVSSLGSARGSKKHGAHTPNRAWHTDWRAQVSCGHPSWVEKSGKDGHQTKHRREVRKRSCK